MSSVAEVLGKLDELSGGKTVKMKHRIEAAHARLVRVNGDYWRGERARGRIYRFLRGDQLPRVEEVADIARAHAQAVPDRIKANRDSNERLAASLRQFIDTALEADPAFFAVQIAGVREALQQLEPDRHPPRDESGSAG